MSKVQLHLQSPCSTRAHEQQNVRQRQVLTTIDSSNSGTGRSNPEGKRRRDVRPGVAASPHRRAPERNLRYGDATEQQAPDRLAVENAVGVAMPARFQCAHVRSSPFPLADPGSQEGR